MVSRALGLRGVITPGLKARYCVQLPIGDFFRLITVISAGPDHRRVVRTQNKRRIRTGKDAVFDSCLRSWALAATPPATRIWRTPCSLARSRVLPTITSTTAFWKLAPHPPLPAHRCTGSRWSQSSPPRPGAGGRFNTAELKSLLPSSQARGKLTVACPRGRLLY